MSLVRSLKRGLRSVAAPCVFIALVGYFLWSATQGDRGLDASPLRQQDLAQALADKERAEADVAVWQRRIDGLHSRIDADALDERARAMLNLSEPHDVIVPYDKGQRLF